MYRQQWQADQHKQIIEKMAGKMPGKSNYGKRKNNERNHHNLNGGRSGGRQGNTDRGGSGGRGRGPGGYGGRGSNNSEHLKTIECFNCGKKGHYSTNCSAPRKNDNGHSNMVSKVDFKNLFQSSLKDTLTKKEKQSKKKDNMEVDDESLDMNIFEKLMEGKHTQIVTKIYDNLKSINYTNIFYYSEQNNMTDQSCKDNNYNNVYDELAYPFSKRIKLKHEPEEAQENNPVQYTADIIVEIKNRDGTALPMTALLDTGTTSTIILREFVGKGRARTNTKKRTKWKLLRGTFTTNYESLLDFKFPDLSTSKVVTWQAHVDDKTSSKEAAYDMIMAMDLMTSTGITVDCEQRCIRWGGTEIPLKTRNTLSNDETLHMLYHEANEPAILQEAEKRQSSILDADYRKFQVDPFVQELEHLTMDEKNILSKTLKKFPTLFGGGLGMLNSIQRHLF
jgi:hypothetical protein